MPVWEPAVAAGVVPTVKHRRASVSENTDVGGGDPKVYCPPGY